MQMYCKCRHSRSRHENYIAAPIQSNEWVEQMIWGVKIEQTVSKFGYSDHFEVGVLGLNYPPT